jgi:hypothetical protein
MRQSWWKFLTVGLLMYTLIGGLLLEVPRLPILNETIRALHFHVTMWFGMILMLLVAAWNSVKYLRRRHRLGVYQCSHFIWGIGNRNGHALGQIYLGRLLEWRSQAECFCDWIAHVLCLFSFERQPFGCTAAWKNCCGVQSFCLCCIYPLDLCIATSYR